MSRNFASAPQESRTRTEMLGTRSAQSAPHPIHPALSSGATHLLLALRVLAIDVEHVRRSFGGVQHLEASRIRPEPREGGMVNVVL